MSILIIALESHLKWLKNASHRTGVACEIVEIKRLITEAQSIEQGDTVELSWHIDDIKNQDDSLTDDEAREILATVISKHDASIGVNWDVIDFHIDEHNAIKQRVLAES